MTKLDDFIERDICIGLITNTDYLRQIIPIWNPRLIESTSARIICGWCIEYGKKWSTAPNKDIESLYTDSLNNLNEETGKTIEGILNSLNEEFVQRSNCEYLLERTEKYFKKRNLLILAEQLKIEAEGGDIEEAERLACGFTPIQRPSLESIEPLSDIEAVKRAFESAAKPLFTYAKDLGKFWNNQFTEEGFISLLGPEKRGKTFILMDLAFRALKSGLKVAFFQAGDMSEQKMVRRQGIYLTNRSDMEKHCGELLIPVLDCIHNQDDSCTSADRECNGMVEGQTDDLRALVRTANLMLREGTDYKACRNCDKIEGTVWYRLRKPVQPLTWKEAYKEFKRFRTLYPEARLKLSTHSNESLSVGHMRLLLDMWEGEDGFRPHVIIIDYADLLAPDPDMTKDFRHYTNKIWQRLRAMSQDRKCLVITATQADARSYNQPGLLNLSNFSEDKRKYAHVTAFYGLNQMPDEKHAGILKINELLLRDDEFDSVRCVSVLQSLQTGRPILGSYF